MAWDWIAKGAKRVQELGSEYKQSLALVERLLTLAPADADAEFARVWPGLDERARASVAMTIAGLTLTQQGSSSRSTARAEGLKRLHALVESAGAASTPARPGSVPDAAMTAARMAHRVADMAERAKPKAASMVESARRGLEQHGPAIESAVKVVLAEIIKAKLGGSATGSSSAPEPVATPTAASHTSVTSVPGVTPPPVPFVSANASADASADTSAERQAAFQQLKAELEQEIAAGTMTPARAARNRAQMAAVERILDRKTDTQTDKRIYLEQMRDALDRQYGAMEDVHGSATSTGSRTQTLMAFATRQQSQLLQQFVQEGMPAGEREALESLAMRTFELVRALDSADDDAAHDLEHALARPLAADVRRHERRAHLTLLTPAWPSPRVVPEPSGIFCASALLLETLDAIAAPRRFTRLTPMAAGRDPAEHGWNLLRSTTVAVFDLREHAPFEQHHDLARAARVAAECYWLGVAYVLGLPVVVIATANQALPFDLDVTPVSLTGDAEGDRARLEDALDGAFYSVHRTATGSSVTETWTHFLARWATVPEGSAVAAQVAEMRDAADADAVVAAQLLRSAIGMLRADDVQIAFPILAARYPDPSQRRCFLVMPFREHVAGAATAIEDACVQAGIQPVRGDRSDDQRILRAIWDDLGRATHVTVDLTDFNPNVALELGIADALGRPTLLIGQPGTERALFPALAKRRLHVYTTLPGGDGSVRTALGRFLQLEAAAARASTTASPPRAAAPRTASPVVTPSRPTPATAPPLPATIAGEWSGVLSGPAGTLDVTYRFAPSGRPMFGYVQKGSGAHNDELTHEGQKIQYVPPGGGVVTVVVLRVKGSATESGFLIKYTFERADNGYLTQVYQQIGLECQLRGTWIEATYLESGNSYFGDRDGSTGGGGRKEYSGRLQRTGA